MGGAASGEQAQVASFLTWRPSPCLTSTAEVVVEEPSGAFLWVFFFTHPSHFTICVWFLAISGSSVQLMHCRLQGKGKKQLVCPLLTEHM